MRLFAFLLALLFFAALPWRPDARAASAYDGKWEVVLTCPPMQDEEDGADGYTHHFPARIKDNVVEGVYGTAGEPGWHKLTGTIPTDGRATLQLDGIIKNTGAAVIHTGRGKTYAYRVRTEFQAASGSGQRVGMRQCAFQFKRVGS